MKLPFALFLLVTFSPSVELLNLEKQDENVEIEVQSDIPQNGQWIFDCALGYAEVPSDFICEAGVINFPPAELNGEVGFWTKCRTICHITYKVQPGDVRLSARLYQSDLVAAVVRDDVSWEFIPGTGWVDFSMDLTGIQNQVSIRLDHLGSDSFVLLDRIVVNRVVAP